MTAIETKTGASGFDNEWIRNDRHFVDAEAENKEEWRVSSINENNCR
jgi:hypothetical protein